MEEIVNSTCLSLWQKNKRNRRIDRDHSAHICYMLHLNKRSCIVTNLIGIQWFTRESIVSPHGETTKYWIEDTSVSGMQRWMKAQTGRRYFSLCSLFLSLLCRWNAYFSCAISFRLRVNAALVDASSETWFFFMFFLLRGLYLQRHSARHKVQFLYTGHFVPKIS